MYVARAPVHRLKVHAQYVRSAGDGSMCLLYLAKIQPLGTLKTLAYLFSCLAVAESGLDRDRGGSSLEIRSAGARKTPSGLDFGRDEVPEVRRAHRDAFCDDQSPSVSKNFLAFSVVAVFFGA